MKGPVEILAKEIGAMFDVSMEREAVLFSYLTQIVGHIEGALRIAEIIKPEPPQQARDFIERVKQMCDGSLSGDDAIQESEIIADLIGEVDDNDGWPGDKYLTLLVGVTFAVRFGLETPCHSRWAAEAGHDVFKTIYGFRLHDSYTSRWSNQWLADRFADGLAALAAKEQAAEGSVTPEARSTVGTNIINRSDAHKGTET